MSWNLLPSHGGSIGGQQRWGIYQNSQGNFYIAIYDAYAVTDAGGGSFPEFFINKSTNGNAWSDVTGTIPSPAVDNEPGGAGSLDNVAITFYNDIIYILGFKKSGINAPYGIVFRFNTLTDSWTTNFPDSLFQPDDTADFDTSFWYSMTVNPTNGVLAFIASGTPQTISTKKYSRVVLYQCDGLAWSGPITIPGQSGVSEHFYAQDFFYSSVGRAHIFLESQKPFDGSFHPNKIYEITISVGGLFGTLQLIDGNGTNNREEAREGATGLGIAYFDHSNVEKIAIPYVNNGLALFHGGPDKSNKVAIATDADLPSWSVTSLDSTTQVAGNQNATESLIGLTSGGGDLYAVWVTPVTYKSSLDSDPSSSNVVYSIYDGSSWSAVNTLRAYMDPLVASGVNPAFLNGGLSAVIFRVDSSESFFDYAGLRHEAMVYAISSTPLNVSVGDSLNFSDPTPSDSILVVANPFFPSDCGKGNLIVEADDIPVNPGLGPGCGGGYDSLIEAD